MTAQLRLDLPEAVEVPEGRACATCGALVLSGCYGPGRIQGESARYQRVRGAFECWTCSPVTWRRYLQRARRRMALILASRDAGYPMTAAQFKAWKLAKRGQQETL